VSQSPDQRTPDLRNDGPLSVDPPPTLAYAGPSAPGYAPWAHERAAARGTDVRGLLDALRRRWLVVATGALFGVVVGGAHSLLATPVYTSTASMYLTLHGGQTPNELVQSSTYAQQLVQSYVPLVTTPTVLAPVVDQLGLNTTPAELARSISVEAAVDSSTIEVRVTRPDAEEAARIARAVSDELPVAAGVLTPSSTDGLQVELATVNPAQVPTAATSPRPTLELALGLVVGGLLGLVAAMVVEAARKPLVNRGAVAAVTDLPVLAILPSPGRRGRGRSRLEPLQESHRSLREALRLSRNGSSRLLVTGCPGTSASTTVAVGLARATAETGRRVLLVDADLRRGDLADIAGLDHDSGLSSVLENREDWIELVQPWGRRGFDVLAAGPAVGDPGRLLGSTVLDRVLAEAAARYDVVILRAGDVLSSADTETLTRRADEIVLLADARRTSTRDLEEVLARLETVSSSSSAHTAGIVLTRSVHRRTPRETSRRHQRASRRRSGL